MNKKQRPHSRLAAISGLALATQAALAQSPAPTPPSPVEIYGIMSAGVTTKNHVANGVQSTAMTNSLLASSLLGFRGWEDLGGGMAAHFRLETAISPNDGTAGGTGKFWNRQSWVGLEWRGQLLTFGRQFSASTDRVVQSLDVYNVSGPSLDSQPLAVFGVNRYASNDTRVDNSVKLRLNGPAGTTAGFSFGLDEGAGRNTSFDLAQITPAYVMAAYGTRYSAPTPIAATGVRPVHQVIGAGAQLPVGPAALYLNLAHSTLDATTAGRAQQKNNIVALGARYAISTFVLKLAYTADHGTDLNGVAGRNGQKQTWVTSVEYYLSRRTSLYVAAFNNRFSDGYKLESLNIAALNRDPAAASMTGYSVGMRHNF